MSAGGPLAESAVLSVRDLSVGISSPDRGLLPIVRGISLTVRRGRILGMVGESGSGKSTVADALLRLNPDTALLSGTVLFEGEDLLALPERRLRAIRGARISLIGQDPLESLNPVQRVGNQIREVLLVHRIANRADSARRALELIAQCGLPDPQATYRRYPHELSGGMRQRVAIAMAIAARPDVVVADEPTTSLDNTIQRQILNLLRALCDERRMGLVLITHDLGIVRDLADDIVVLYAGSVVETGPAAQVLARPQHQYTRALLASQPRIADGARPWLTSIPGTAPLPEDVGAGCAFAPRCARAADACAARPELRARDEFAAHLHSCHRPGPASAEPAEAVVTPR